MVRSSEDDKEICRAKVIQPKRSRDPAILPAIEAIRNGDDAALGGNGGEQKLIASYEVGSHAAHWCAPRRTLCSEFRLQRTLCSGSFPGVLQWNLRRQIHPQNLADSADGSGSRTLSP